MAAAAAKAAAATAAVAKARALVSLMSDRLMLAQPAAVASSLPERYYSMCVPRKHLISAH